MKVSLSENMILNPSLISLTHEFLALRLWALAGDWRFLNLRNELAKRKDLQILTGTFPTKEPGPHQFV